MCRIAMASGPYDTLLRSGALNKVSIFLLNCWFSITILVLTTLFVFQYQHQDLTKRDILNVVHHYPELRPIMEGFGKLNFICVC
jgi:hypothetical protein